MRRVLNLHLFNLAFIASSAMLLSLVSDKKAVAECGDYVLVGGTSRSAIGEAIRDSSRPGLRHTGDRPIDRERPAPCRGLACSERNPVPGPSAPATALVQSLPDWALPAIPVVLTGTERTRYSPITRLAVSNHYFARILRPPRLA